jgi:hypothetical protein
MLYFALRAFGFLITKHKHKSNNLLFSLTPLVLIHSLLFLILSSISLPSSLPISPHFLLFLSLISPHVFDLLTILALPPAPSLSPRPHLCNPLSFSSLTHTLSPPYCTSILLFSPSSSKFSSVSPVSHPI